MIFQCERSFTAANQSKTAVGVKYQGSVVQSNDDIIADITYIIRVGFKKWRQAIGGPS